MSILGNPIMAGSSGGGGGSCAVELHGGPGETVTWSDGTNTGTVTLSATGDGALTLPVGGYTFLFSLGSAVTGAIAATIQTGITNVVKGWGGRAPAYWFGRIFGYATANNATVAPAYNTNRIELTSTLYATTRYFEFTDVVISGTAAKAFVDTTGAYAGSVPATIRGTSVTATNSQTAGQTGVYLLGEVSGSGTTTLGVTWRPNSNSNAGGINLYAIWLE